MTTTKQIFLGALEQFEMNLPNLVDKDKCLSILADMIGGVITDDSLPEVLTELIADFYELLSDLIEDRNYEYSDLNRRISDE